MSTHTHTDLNENNLMDTDNNSNNKRDGFNAQQT